MLYGGDLEGQTILVSNFEVTNYVKDVLNTEDTSYSM